MQIEERSKALTAKCLHYRRFIFKNRLTLFILAPDAPPSIVETWPGTTDSIKIFWNPIPESKRSGIILSYRIFYKPLDVPLHKYNRAPRSVNQYAAYGALPGEKMLVVNATTYQVEIADLKFYSWYQVRIGAVTSQGLGVTFSINGTCKQGSK